MAISSLYPRKTMRNRQRFMADRLDYDQKAEKTIDGDLVSSYMCLPESAAEEFEARCLPLVPLAFRMARTFLLVSLA